MLWFAFHFGRNIQGQGSSITLSIFDNIVLYPCTNNVCFLVSFWEVSPHLFRLFTNLPMGANVLVLSDPKWFTWAVWLPHRFWWGVRVFSKYWEKHHFSMYRSENELPVILLWILMNFVWMQKTPLPRNMFFSSNEKMGSVYFRRVKNHPCGMHPPSKQIVLIGVTLRF